MGQGEGNPLVRLIRDLASPGLCGAMCDGNVLPTLLNQSSIEWSKSTVKGNELDVNRLCREEDQISGLVYGLP